MEDTKEQVQQGMTIKRALTRKKTIKSQMADIVAQMQQYGAVSSKAKHLMGDQRGNDAEALTRNHKEARVYVQSLLQQFLDLQKEYTRISVAIQKANQTTFIEVAGQRMSIAEALEYQGKAGTGAWVAQLVNAFNSSVANSERVVSQYNSQLGSVDQATKEAIQATVVSLLDPKDLQKLSDFRTKFMMEANGLIDEANIGTYINL